MKQTSIEWLWEQIDNIVPYQNINVAQQFNGLLKLAKEMHKQEIIDARDSFVNEFHRSIEELYMKGQTQTKTMTSEEYYQETFKQPKKDKL